MKHLDRRYRHEQRLHLWLRVRGWTEGWQWWDLWRVVFWAILIGVALVTVDKYYAYR